MCTNFLPLTSTVPSASFAHYLSKRMDVVGQVQSYECYDRPKRVLMRGCGKSALSFRLLRHGKQKEAQKTKQTKEKENV